LRGEADAAYRPVGINHARPAQKKSAKPETLLVFEMYARQKNLTRLQVSTYGGRSAMCETALWLFHDVERRRK